MNNNVYPIIESIKGPPVTVKLSDFPVRFPCNMESDTYLIDRGISYDYFDSLESAYCTRHGICFVLTGPGLGFQERIMNDKRRFLYPKNFNASPFVYVPDSQALDFQENVI